MSLPKVREQHNLEDLVKLLNENANLVKSRAEKYDLSEALVAVSLLEVKGYIDREEIRNLTMMRAKMDHTKYQAYKLLELRDDMYFDTLVNEEDAFNEQGDPLPTS
jgi:hypothetical protein